MAWQRGARTVARSPPRLVLDPPRPAAVVDLILRESHPHPIAAEVENLTPPGNLLRVLVLLRALIPQQPLRKKHSRENPPTIVTKRQNHPK